MNRISHSIAIVARPSYLGMGRSAILRSRWVLDLINCWFLMTMESTELVILTNCITRIFKHQRLTERRLNYLRCHLESYGLRFCYITFVPWQSRQLFEHCLNLCLECSHYFEHFLNNFLPEITEQDDSGNTQDFQNIFKIWEFLQYFLGF